MKKRSDDKSTPETAMRSCTGDGIFSILYCVVIFVVFSLAAVLIHFPSYQSPFVYDSILAIQRVEPVLESHDLSRILTIIPARPLFVITLYLNYLSTGMDPFYFRLTGSLLLAATGLSLSILCMLVLSVPGGSSNTQASHRRWVALGLGALFIAHPLQSNAVLYVIQREAILACLFYFSGLAAYTAMRTERIGTAAGYTLTALFFFLGLLCKENTATLPVALVLVDYVLLGRPIGETIKRALKIAAFAVPIMIVYVLITHSLQGPVSTHAQGISARLAVHYRESGLSVYEVFLTQPRVICTYLLMILAPYVWGADLIRAMTVSRSLVDPPATAIAIAVLIALLALALAVVRRHRVPAFAVLFFFVSLIPESLLIPQYLFFGYRAILPMLGVLLIVGWAMLGLLERLRQSGHNRVGAAVVAGVAGTLAVALGVQTVLIAWNWNPVSFWQRAYDRLPPYSEYVEKVPYSTVVLNYGRAQAKEGNYAAAEEPLKQALKFRPESTTALFFLGQVYLHKPDYDRAVQMLTKAVEVQPAFTEARLDLAAAYIQARRYEEAIKPLKKIIEDHPDLGVPHANLGIALFNLGRMEEAKQHLEKALELRPGLTVVHMKLGAIYESERAFDKAIQQYSKAVKAAPKDPSVHFAIASCLMRSGNPAGAQRYFERAIQHDPMLFQAHYGLGIIAMWDEDYRTAIRHFNRVMEIKPDWKDTKEKLQEAMKLADQAMTKETAPDRSNKSR